MLEQPKPVAASLNPSTHNQPTNCQVIKLRHNWYGPAQMIQGGCQLSHCYQGLTLDCAPVSIDLQNVHQVDLRLVDYSLIVITSCP